MDISNIRKLYTDVLGNVKKVMIGNDDIFTLVFSAMLADGHVLLEDNPGTGKTTLAKTIARSIDSKFARVQFTPDLMPQDITGLNIYSQKSSEFEFVPGPIFTNILLADEINRATPRTQSALLQAMEEREVTSDGVTRTLDAPFLVIATENPIETAGTFPLPEAQLDRFLIKITMGDLSKEDERDILLRFKNDEPLEEIAPVANAEALIEASKEIKNVTVREDVLMYIVSVAEATRKSPKLFTGVSPRASLSLMRMAQSFAAVSGRDFVTPDDVKFLAPYVFAHRVKPSAGNGTLHESRDIIKELVEKVEVPVEDWKTETKKK